MILSKKDIIDLLQKYFTFLKNNKFELHNIINLLNSEISYYYSNNNYIMINGWFFEIDFEIDISYKLNSFHETKYDNIYQISFIINHIFDNEKNKFCLFFDFIYKYCNPDIKFIIEKSMLKII